MQVTNAQWKQAMTADFTNMSISLNAVDEMITQAKNRIAFSVSTENAQEKKKYEQVLKYLEKTRKALE